MIKDFMTFNLRRKGMSHDLKKIDRLADWALEESF